MGKRPSDVPRHAKQTDATKRLRDAFFLMCRGKNRFCIRTNSPEFAFCTQAQLHSIHFHSLIVNNNTACKQFHRLITTGLKINAVHIPNSIPISINAQSIVKPLTFSQILSGQIK